MTTKANLLAGKYTFSYLYKHNREPNEDEDMNFQKIPVNKKM